MYREAITFHKTAGLAFVFICILFALTGCGIADRATENCGGDLDPFCDALFGFDEDEQNDRLDDIEDRLELVEADEGCVITPVSGGHTIDCGDGAFLIADGQDGSNGRDGVDGVNGADGKDGRSGVNLRRRAVAPGQCRKVARGIYVENIQNGRLFDVYSNSSCSDRDGEYCDNVVPGEGSTGKLDEYEGSATVCWAGRKTQISGMKRSDGSLLIYLLKFR